jgi:CRP-like cAMP-binding protein
MLADTELDPDDPYAREAQAFPHLSDDMIRRPSRAGLRRRGAAQGTLLFERGPRSVDVCLVQEGWGAIVGASRRRGRGP